jgi:hypothetical protein
MVKITVGEVTVEYDGQLSVRALRRLLIEVAGVAAAVTVEVEAEEEKGAPVSLGFTTEIGKPEEPDNDWYFEDTARRRA